MENATLQNILLVTTFGWEAVLHFTAGISHSNISSFFHNKTRLFLTHSSLQF